MDRVPYLITALALGLLLSSASTMAQTLLPDGTPAGLQRFVAAHHPGWNLGNTFDATGDETSWGNPSTTKALIDQIAASGFKSIRIPITWGHRMGDAPDYAIRPEFMARIKEVVGWAMDAKLYVMMNLHHDSGWIHKMPDQRQQVQARFDAAWTQIAREFRDYPLTLTFEGINEPKFSDDWGKDSPQYYELLESLNLSFHKIVRTSGGNNATRPLILSTLAAANSQPRLEQLYATVQKLNDPNLIATFHYYGFWPFSVNIAGVTTFDDRSRNDIVEGFDRAQKTLVARGIPVIVGECGLLGFDKSTGVVEHGEILKYFEFLSHYARTTQMPLMLWDNGQHYDRRKMTWRDPLLLSVITSPARSANLSTDTIFLRENGTLGNVEIPLNLNGNTLDAIRLDGKALQSGTDYTLTADRLVLKAAVLKPFASGDHGLKATFTCDFSAGADWPIHVIHFARPVQAPSEGPATSFRVPTDFNGDRLATMEAIYTTGGNAGPHNWTPFKEFEVAFKPDYDAGVIHLTPQFFKDVKDGQARLKFHFWSGEVLNYLITRKGDTITGAPEQQ